LVKAVQALRVVGHLGVKETYGRYSVAWVEDHLMSRGGREGDVRQSGVLRATVLKAVQGSAGGGDTWGQGDIGMGTPITKNKILFGGFEREKTSDKRGTVNRN
jgi:hypothetical protein